ncbi:hypothetical protein BHE74_00055025, partial [Ensete ventricosum]
NLVSPPILRSCVTRPPPIVRLDRPPFSETSAAGSGGRRARARHGSIDSGKLGFPTR